MSTSMRRKPFATLDFAPLASVTIQDRLRGAGLWGIGAVLLIGILFPLLVMLVVSVSRPLDYGGVAWGHLSTNAYRELFFEQDLDGLWVFQADNLRILLRSASLAFIATTLCVAISFPTALYVATREARRRSFLLLLIGAPFVVSLVIRVYGLMTLFADGGLLNRAMNAVMGASGDLGLLYTNTAIIFGLVYVFFPFMTLPIYASLREFDWEQVEAAYVLGASPVKVLFSVIVPGCMRGIVAGVGMVFVPALGAYVVSDLLGGSKTLMIGNLVQLAFTTHRDWPFGAALSLMLLALVAWCIGFRFDKREAQKSTTADKDRPTGFSWSVWVAFPVLAILYAPILAMIAMSFNTGTSALVWEGWGLTGYLDALHDDNLVRAAVTSFMLAATTVFIATALATVTGVSLRGGRRGTSLWIERGIFAPMVIPEIVLAIATLLGFSVSGIELSFWTALFAHVVFCLPVAYLPIRASLNAMDQEQLDASASLGATPWQTFWQVTLPAIRSGIMAGALLAFVSSLDDFVTTFFVAGAGVITLPTYIYAALKVGITPKINAISTVLVLLSFITIAPVVFLKLGSTSRRKESASPREHRLPLVQTTYGA
ncbi:ABC transporter permease subunit [Paraburkholderia megapolitana]|uniref:ABC transporter permease subunit n=1 Tax=Paraburkholderia megapolitana TaxID=420953 RepID=UPI0038B83079